MSIRLGLAALLASALRSAAPNHEQNANNEAQQRQIDAVRSGFESLKAELAALREGGTALDATQTERLEAIEREMTEMADVLTGPADNPEDNGVIAEVQLVSEDAPTSSTADTIVQDAIDEGIDVPEVVPLPEVLPVGGQGDEVGLVGRGEGSGSGEAGSGGAGDGVQGLGDRMGGGSDKPVGEDRASAVDAGGLSESDRPQSRDEASRGGGLSEFDRSER